MKKVNVTKVKSQTLFDVRKQKKRNSILPSLLVDNALTMFLEITTLFGNFHPSVQTNTNRQTELADNSSLVPCHMFSKERPLIEKLNKY